MFNGLNVKIQIYSKQLEGLVTGRVVQRHFAYNFNPDKEKYIKTLCLYNKGYTYFSFNKDTFLHHITETEIYV